MIVAELRDEYIFANDDLYFSISAIVFGFVSGSSIAWRVGVCSNGIMRTCPGKETSGALASGVVKGPFAVVRYASDPIDVIRCFARLGLDRQKKQLSGPGGGGLNSWCRARFDRW